jgi:hypothetical protein
LEYLRTGFWLLGDRGRNRTFLDALRAEALFYGLEGPVPEIFTAEVTEYFSIWSADDGHVPWFLYVFSVFLADYAIPDDVLKVQITQNPCTNWTQNMGEVTL